MVPTLPVDTPWPAAVLTVVLVAVTTLLVNRPIRRQQKQIAGQQREIVEQVSNSHDTNLRDDLDSVRHMIGDVAQKQETVLEQQRETRRDIGGLREELRTERQERLQLADRVDAQGHQLSQLDRRKD